MVWRNLKSEQRLKGKKRVVDENDNVEVHGDEKRLCISLDVSGTCDRFGVLDLESSSCESSKLRGSSDSDSSIDVSYLLESTRSNGLSEVLIENARNLLQEIEELPLLSSETESEQNEYVLDEASESDSGNSEIRWGYTNVVRVMEEGGVRNVAGEIVPATLGHSSISDSDEDAERILALMRNFEEPADGETFSNSDFRISTPESEGRPYDSDIDQMGEIIEVYWDDAVMVQERPGLMDNAIIENEMSENGNSVGYESGDEWSSSRSEDSAKSDMSQVDGCAVRQVTRTASSPQGVAGNESQPWAGVSNRADVGGGTMAAAGVNRIIDPVHTDYVGQGDSGSDVVREGMVSLVGVLEIADEVGSIADSITLEVLPEDSK